ncbi:MAG: hypothetical protein A2152_00525 [Candidatus Levybacteria bacterium RBG_16_35_6]|nr:MAG: hypothetical protein A2152_00525 [Candidatus Levybacteria bacterium RBG_16_35_6]
MKVALVYDRINKWGGAERVLLALHKIFPDAPLFTSVYNPKKAKWAKVFSVKTSFLQKIPNAKSSHELLGTLMPLAFENLRFDDYDLVISVTSEAAKGIVTKPQTTHICYCLTPTRYLWSGYEIYFKNNFLRFLAKPAVSYLKKWEIVSSSRPDKYIAISNEVKKRIKKYYGFESSVIYPPVNIPKIKPAKENKGKYFLVVSRLTPYKRVDLAIKACNRLNLPLKIIGTGYQLRRLKLIAGPTIKFLGEVSEKKLKYYYENCKALIFPGVEDFGLTMVEAQSYGKPVIAFSGGGAKEIVKKGETGEFFNRQEEKSLVDVLKNFDVCRYNSLSCYKNSQRFSFEKFRKSLKEFLDENLSYTEHESVT